MQCRRRGCNHADAEPEHIPHIHGVWTNNTQPCPCNGVHHDDDYMPPPSPPPGRQNDAAFLDDEMSPLFRESYAPASGLAEGVIDISSDDGTHSISAISDDVLVGNSFAALAVDDDDDEPSDDLLAATEDEHEVVQHRNRTCDKREADLSLTLRRSRRLAGIEGPAFVDMTTKAIRAKAKKFDLTAASSGLPAAITAAGLADPDCPPSNDVDALSLVAVECGATSEDVREIAAVPSPLP